MAEEDIQEEQPKEKKQDCPAGAPAWMVTYSDLVTLLLTFFVLLLSMASMDPIRVLQASSSLRDAFGMHETPATVDFTIPVIPSPPITQFSPIQENTTKRLYEKVKSQIESLRLNDEVGVIQQDDKSIVLRLKDSVLFKPGEKKISPRAYSVLRSVADIIRPLPMDLRIEGHTDDQTVSKSPYGNWDLSVDRSVSVLKYLAQGDLLHLDRMSSVGYGGDRPAVPNRDEATRALNRRVDFVLKLNDQATKGKSGASTVPL
jgi:chemotaxis protein MotB